MVGVLYTYTYHELRILKYNMYILFCGVSDAINYNSNKIVERGVVWWKKGLEYKCTIIVTWRRTYL